AVEVVDRAVDRVHDPAKTFELAAFTAFFFPQDRLTWAELREPLPDEPFDGAIAGGYHICFSALGVHRAIGHRFVTDRARKVTRFACDPHRDLTQSRRFSLNSQSHAHIGTQPG